MPDPFDPYHQWLGIPPEEQPPHHYRLLAVKPFETDPNVIENAADQRMGHLRTFQTGKHGELSQKLLNEVAAAKLCLLQPERKAAYDAGLKQQLAAQDPKPAAKKELPRAVPLAPAPKRPAPRVRTGEQPAPPAATSEPGAASGTALAGRSSPTRGSVWKKQAIVFSVVGVGFLLMLSLLVWGLSGGDGSNPPAPPDALVFDWPQGARAGTTLWIDQRRFHWPDSGPLTVPCKPGKYDIRAEREGFEPYEQVVTVAAGERPKIPPPDWRAESKPELEEPSRLVLQWPEDQRGDATLEIDGKEVDLSGRQIERTSEQLSLPIRPGEHKIWIARRGLPPWENTFTVMEGNNVTLAPAWRDSDGPKSPERERPAEATRTTEVADAGEETAILPGDAPPPAAAPFDGAKAKRHQQAWAKCLGLPVEREIELPGGVKLILVLIPPGEFLMGSTQAEQTRFLDQGKATDDHWTVNAIPEEGPQHKVKISQPFYLGKYEVTQAQWEAVMGSNPSQVQNPTNPVEDVSWDDIQPLLEKLNQKHKNEGMKFVLPTEARWEYACRAGTTTAWHCGDSEATLRQFAWFSANSGGKTHPVGELKPNAWGLHDMHGNVWEWCEDWHKVDFYVESPTDDPSGPPAGSRRVRRGGRWRNQPGRIRSAHRGNRIPSHNKYNLGFRLAAVLTGGVTIAEAKPKAAADRNGAEVPGMAEVKRRREERYSKALEPVEKKVAVWDFRGAWTELKKIKFEEDGLVARLKLRRDEVRRMGRLKLRMVAKINAARPRLRKHDLALKGFAGEITGADERAITAQLGSGNEELHAWGDLSKTARTELLERVVDPASGDDWLAAALMAVASKDVKLADELFGKAREKGTDVGAHQAPLAAIAFGQTKQILEKEQFAEAEKSLAWLEKKYGETPWFGAHESIIAEAHKAAQSGIYNAKAESLYADAVALFKERKLFDLKPLASRLRTEFPDSTAVIDEGRKPSLSEMEAAVANLGKFITVRQDGKGDFQDIQAAINNAPPKSLVEIQDNGPYFQQVTIPRAKTGLTLRGKDGCWPIIQSGGAAGALPYVLQVGAQDTSLERLVLANPLPTMTASTFLSRAPRLHARLLVCGAANSGNCVDIAATGTLKDCCVSVSCFLRNPTNVENLLFLGDTNIHVRGTGKGRLENILARNLYLESPVELHNGTVTEKVVIEAANSRIADSILAPVNSVAVGNALMNCNTMGAVTGIEIIDKKCFSANPLFVDPANYDFRLAPGSPCIKKASDGGNLGFRYSPEMAEILRIALELRQKGIFKF